jgi:hypothetical protein
MWDRLSVPAEYRSRFLDKHTTLTQVELESLVCSTSLMFIQEVLDAYEDEVRRQRHHIKGAGVPRCTSHPLSSLQSRSTQPALASKQPGVS